MLNVKYYTVVVCHHDFHVFYYIYIYIISHIVVLVFLIDELIVILCASAGLTRLTTSIVGVN